MLIFMKPILRPLLPLLFLAVLVTPPTHAEEALATLVVRLRPVALTFPVESVVEAVQQAVVSSPGFGAPGGGAGRWGRPGQER